MSSDKTKHYPVMLNQILSIISPQHGGIFIDCTFGGGGYSRAILKYPNTKVYAIDRDKYTQHYANHLVKKFPKQIVGVKDSSYNLYENLKIPNFMIFPGSETKLLKGLKLGCSGIISAICNVTAPLARKVFDDFNDKKEQTVNEKLIKVRETFDNYPLIPALHSFMSNEDEKYKNLLPPLTLLSEEKKQELLSKLKELNFIPKTNSVAA